MFTVSPSAVGSVKMQQSCRSKFMTILAVILMEKTKSPSGPSVQCDLPGGQWLLEWSSASSCQRDGDGTVGPAATPRVNAGLGELLAVLFGLLVSDVGEEAQRDRVPLLGQQQEQEAQADDAGGGETHHAKDDLVL